MANVIIPKVRPAFPVSSKVPLNNFIAQFNVPGSTPESNHAAALLVRTGNGGCPAGTGTK